LFRHGRSFLDRSRRRDQRWLGPTGLAVVLAGLTTAPIAQAEGAAPTVEETPVSDPGIVGVGLMSAGGVGILGGIAVGAVSLTRPPIMYQGQTGTEGDYRAASGIILGMGMGLFAVGAAIFVLDPTPSVLSNARIYLGPTGGGCVVSF